MMHHIVLALATVLMLLAGHASAIKDQCSIAPIGTAGNNFWLSTRALSGAPTVTITIENQTQRVPDVCQRGFDAFDGRCYAYSLGLFGAPTSLPHYGLGNKPQTDAVDAETICSNSIYALDAQIGGSHLVSVHTDRENCYIHEKIPSHVYFRTGPPTNPAYVLQDGRSFNDFNGCHSNNRGSTGTCWMGLGQKVGTTGSSSFGWNDGYQFDRVPWYAGGFSKWGSTQTFDPVLLGTCFDMSVGQMRPAPSPTPSPAPSRCPSPYEPNNVGLAAAEDCIQIWDRDRNGGEWNDEPCSLLYPYICTKMARCQPGFSRTAAYRGMPVRPNPLVNFGVWDKVDATYSMGQCTQCLAGFFHPQDSINNYESPCFPCRAGFYGTVGQINDLCTAICPVGNYCPAGTGVYAIKACPAGTYNPVTGAVSFGLCQKTPAGKYSLEGSALTTQCDAGRCGYDFATSSQCQSPCPAGHYCAAGTGCFNLTDIPPIQPRPCDFNNKYSAGGRSVCDPVPGNSYSTGGTISTRTGYAICPTGAYCVEGVRNLCPAGRFNDVTGAQYVSDCLPCSEGFICTAGSSVATQLECYQPSLPNPPEMYFCPAGSSFPLNVTTGYYTTPATTGARTTRSGQAICASTDVCIEGISRPKVTWGLSSCNDISIYENTVTAVVGRNVTAVLNPGLVGLGYTLAYSLESFKLAPDLFSSYANGPCDPETNAAPWANAGIIAVNNVTGAIMLTRTTYPFWLNYEPTGYSNATADTYPGAPCSLIAPRYVAAISVTARGQSTVVQLTCNVKIVVRNVNDNPVWVAESVGITRSYRTIKERQVVNTAANLCDSEAVARGCPIIPPSSVPSMMKAYDEDVADVLRYRIVLGVGSATMYTSNAQNPFRINSCSGLITLQDSFKVLYYQTQIFNFTVEAFDDGGGGEFLSKSAFRNLIIFITPIPNPPELPNAQFKNFSVFENRNPDQVVGSIVAFNPDGNVTMNYFLKPPIDGNAFYFDSSTNEIRTTFTGSDYRVIDYESTKTTFSITVVAYVASDSTLRTEATYQIFVRDTNDPPRFQYITSFYVFEGSVPFTNVCFAASGSSCLQSGDLDRVSTFDQDATVNDVTRYSVNDPTYFNINSSTGQIYVAANATLDFQREDFDDSTGTGKSVKVTVRATSMVLNSPSTNSYTEQIYTVYLIRINHAPIFTAVPDFFVLRTAPVGSACDPSDGSSFIAARDHDNNLTTLKLLPVDPQELTFSRAVDMVHPTLNDSSVLFDVFPLSTGRAAIRVIGDLNAAVAPIGGLQCGAGSTSTTKCYIIAIRVTDNGQPSLWTDTWVTIRVVDVNSAPYLESYTLSINVPESIPGQAFDAPNFVKASIDVQAYDRDRSSLLISAVSGSALASFTLVQTANSFAIYKKAGAGFDFEKDTTQYTMAIQVADYTNSSQWIGTGCGISNGQLTQCGAGTYCDVKQGPFVVEYRCFETCRPSDSGVLEIPRRDSFFCDYTQLVPPGRFPVGEPYVQTAERNLIVTINIIDQNDPPYIIDSAQISGLPGCTVTASVIANRQNANQTAVSALIATDQDRYYAAAPYTFAKANSLDPFWATFDLNPNTGAIQIFPSLNASGINTNKFLVLNQTFNSSVVVYDAVGWPALPFQSQQNSSCFVVVTVGQTFTQPVFPNPASVMIAERSPIGMIVYSSLAPNGSLTNIDPDVGAAPPDVLTFSMSESPFFLLNSATSQLTLFGQLLDYESASPSFAQTLDVRVTTNKNAVASAQVTVVITDVNEAPTWTAVSYTFPINEYSTPGTVVINLLAVSSDPDIFANGVTTFKNTTYSIISGCVSLATCPFELVSATNGSLRVRTSLNYELVYTSAIVPTWSFKIRAADGGQPTTLFNDVQVSVILVHVRRAPTFSSGNAVNVTEGTAGSLLADLTTLITRRDFDDPVSSMQFNITGGDPSGLFTITQGRLFVATGQILDYELKSSYNISVTITSTFGLVTTGFFPINVLNVNDVTITNVVVVGGGSTINCAGTSQVVLTGTNFGVVSKIPIATVVVRYRRPITSRDPSPPLFNASNCTVTSTDNTAVTCTVPTGSAGFNLAWDVSITVASTPIQSNAFTNFPSTISFDRPVITSVTGASSLATMGGQTVLIFGACFGTTTTPDLLTYGSLVTGLNASFVEFCSSGGTICSALARCTSSNRSLITCATSTPVGLGTQLRWRVGAADQVSTQYEQGAYAPPTLTTTNTITFPTSGVITGLVMNGTNFGVLGSAPDSAYFVYQNTSYRILSCLTTIAHTQITCQGTDPGVGSSMRAFVTFGGQTSVQSSFTFNFEAAIVTSISGQGASEGASIGGQLVVLQGFSFGPMCGTPGSSIDSGGVNCPFVTATYTRGSISVVTGLPIVYTAFPCAVLTQIQMVCATAPGSGAGHVWTLTIGGRLATMSPMVSTTSYGAPVVATYEGPGAKAALTDGSQVVFVQGSNFGPVGGAAVSGQYGNKNLNPTEFTSPACYVLVAHQTISCLTAPGAGDQLSWQVIVDGLLGKNQQTNYKIPALHSSSFNSLNDYLNPDGNNVVVITGTNFGSSVFPGPYLRSVTFGPVGFTIAYTASCVVSSHTQLVCNLGPGIGSKLAMVANIKGQFSVASPFLVRYYPPEIVGFNYNGQSLQTIGGNLIFVQGTGFALCDPQASIRVIWQEDIAGAIVRIVDVVAWRNQFGQTVTSLNCPIGLNAEVGFLIPEMNVARDVLVSVNVTSTAIGQTITSGIPVAFRYANPVLTSVFAQASTVSLGGVRVTMFGSNFCKSYTCCQPILNGITVPLGSIILFSHTRIIVELSQTGTMFILCGSSPSNSIQFTANNPLVIGTVPQLDLVKFKTAGNETFEIWGMYFGTDQAPNITVGTKQLTVLSYDPVSCMDPSRPATSTLFNFANDAQCYKTVVRTPSGTGSDLPLTVSRGSSLSSPGDLRYEFFDYYPPSVMVAAGSAFDGPLDGLGNAEILLIGKNFGLVQGSVFIGSVSDPVLCAVTFWTDSEIHCDVLEGEGTALEVFIVQDDGVTASAGVTVSFSPPANLFFDASVKYVTQGGSIFVLTGNNFGRSMRPTVLVNGLNCAVINSTQSSVTCYSPGGEGINKIVRLTTGGQTATAAMLFAYQIPVIFSVTPSTDISLTNGLKFSVVGQNFGINKLRIYFDTLIVAQRFLDPDPTLSVNDFIISGTNHTHLLLDFPKFFGSMRLVTIWVDGQLSTGNTTIAFRPPEVGVVRVYLDGGAVSPDYSSVQDYVFPPNAFNATGEGLPNSPSATRRRLYGKSRLSLSQPRRNLATQSASYGVWQTSNFSLCESNVATKGQFWEWSHTIAPNGDYVKTIRHYVDEVCSTDKRSHVVEISGKFSDLGAHPNDLAVSFCGLGRSYSDSIHSLKVTIVNENALSLFLTQCNCVQWVVGVTSNVTSTCIGDRVNCPLLYRPYGVRHLPGALRYGAYVISNGVELFMSLTSSSLDALNGKTSVDFPDVATATVSASVSSLQSSIPEGPTDGCYKWEDIRDYLNRAQTISLNSGIPTSEVPRICLRRALLEIVGTDLGVPLTALQIAQLSTSEPPSLRVFFIRDEDPTNPFEASTVAARGSHGVKCPTPDCFQTSNLVRVWVPYGIGRSLRIRVFIGDQSTYSTIRFSYYRPYIDELSPGSVRYNRAFQSAQGEPVTIRGYNFGGVATQMSVLLNGRPCLNPEWIAGSTDDSDGRPYLYCDSQRDVVGPRSILICVASQLTFNKLYRTDGSVLVAGEVVGAWNSTTPAGTYSRQLRSLAVARCPAGLTGRLYELCQTCPRGAICEDGSFAGPVSNVKFFNQDVLARDENGDITERAITYCAREAINTSLVDDFPDLIQRNYCAGFVGCEPPESCAGNNLCATGYEYAKYKCMARRGYANSTSVYSLTRAQVLGTRNSCNITLDPYTFEYVGVNQDCRGTLAEGLTCTVANPEQCAKCTVLNEVGHYYGVCECTLPTRCSLCTIGKFFRLNNECQPCPENPALLIGMLFFVAFIIVLLGWWLSRSNVNMAFITIGIDYFQVLAIFSATKVHWPPTLQALFNIMSVFNLNIDITAPECITPDLTYETKWWLQMSIPLALTSILAVIYFGYMFIKMFWWGIYASHVYTSHLSSLISTFMIAMYFMYLVLTKKALDVFNCNPITPSDGYFYTSFASLECDGGGLCRCGVPGGPQMRLIPFAIVFLILYTFGFFAFTAYVLRRNILLVREDQYLRAYDVGFERKTNPDCYDLRKRYSRLYYQFKPRFAHFWILVLLLRKFWVAFAALLFRGNPSFQLAIILLVLFVSIVFQVLWRPFMSNADMPDVQRELDAMAERSIKEPRFAQFREVRRRVQEVMTLDVEYRRRKKMKGVGTSLFDNANVEESGRNLGANMAAKLRTGKLPPSVAAALWFSNLNTLEFILLACGILICLSGIIFEASYNDNRAIVKGQVDFMAYVILFIVIFSIVYYVLFFMSEVSPVCMSTVLALCRRKGDNDDKDDYYDRNINLQENPMFSAPKIAFADNSGLKKDLEAQTELLRLAEAQNKKLRDDLKRQKIEQQLDETANMPKTGIEDVKPQKQRKDFAQTRLNAALVGPNRARARGGAKVREEEEDDD